MGRAPCCSKVGLYRGPWTTKEDTLLIDYIQAHGEGHWRSLPKKAGCPDELTMRSRTTGTLTLAKDSRTARQGIGPHAWGNQLEREATLRPATKGRKRRTTKAFAVEKWKAATKTQDLSPTGNKEDGDHTSWGMSGLKVANNGGQAWASNDEEFDGLVCDHDPSCPISLQKDIMLDDIFEEYQQLLKADDHGHLDSFVDSLLA
ncbi:hypothetical protein D5086_000768 [Populus alba]|uniref:Uncharacterized protein n=1 Tax=Populus alba TaxID=43335 RepID=A0ACC4CX97_POPAL